MRRFLFLLYAGVPSVVAAQGFGLYEHGTCTMGRAGVATASPCNDGSAIFFNPAGLAGLSGTHLSVGATLIGASGNFTDDFIAHRTDLDNPLIPVPNVYLTRRIDPKLTVGIGSYFPYGLETRWPTEGFPGRFVGYNTEVRSAYIQPTAAYQVHERLKVGIGFAYIVSDVKLRQRVDLSAQLVTGQPFTFAALGIPAGSDFADANLTADGTGFAVNFGAIFKVTDRLTIGARWLTRKTIDYDGSVDFTQLPTGLKLAANNPLGLPAETLLDTLPTIEALFGVGGPLSDQAATTELTMPPQGSIGFAYRVRDDWTVMGDYQYVAWGWFNTVVINFANPLTRDITLTPRNDDTHGFRLGVEHRHSAKVTVRGGYLYHTASSPDDFVTPLLPEAPRNEVTVGVGLSLTPKLQADLAYQFVRQQDRRGLAHGTAIGNTGLYEFWAHLVGAGLSYTF